MNLSISVIGAIPPWKYCIHRPRISLVCGGKTELLKMLILLHYCAIIHLPAITTTQVVIQGRSELHRGHRFAPSTLQLLLGMHPGGVSSIS
jgi:hypothetical protein